MANDYEKYAKRATTVRTTRTYISKCESMLHSGLPLDPIYWDLLDEALDLALEIICVLPDNFFETTQSEAFFGLAGGPVNLSDAPHERVQKLADLLERRRAAGKRAARISKLEQVEGRTEVEAAAFRAKAAELRSK